MSNISFVWEIYLCNKLMPMHCRQHDSCLDKMVVISVAGMDVAFRYSKNRLRRKNISEFINSINIKMSTRNNACKFFAT